MIYQINFDLILLNNDLKAVTNISNEFEIQFSGPKNLFFLCSEVEETIIEQKTIDKNLTNNIYLFKLKTTLTEDFTLNIFCRSGEKAGVYSQIAEL